jgi:hypothetical protein
MVDQCVASLVRHHRAKKRFPSKIHSLQTLVPGDPMNPVELGGNVCQGAHAERSGSYARSAEDVAQLVQDVAAVWAGLPEDLRHLIVIWPSHSVAATSRIMGETRAVIYGMIRRLKRIFENAGLGDYF